MLNGHIVHEVSPVGKGSLGGKVWNERVKE